MHSINTTRSKKWLYLLLMVVLVLAVSGVFLLRSFAWQSHPRQVAKMPLAGLAENIPQSVSGKSTDHASDESDVKSSNARAIFTNPSLSVGKRFSALVKYATAGDANAKHFALQIANECKSLEDVPDDQPALGQSKASAYQIRLQQQMKASCAEVIVDPAFSEFSSILKSFPADVFDGSMKMTIRQQFANEGPASALNAAVSAISQRPDELTVGMVGDELANLDISSIYLQPALSSIDSVNPSKRNQLMRYALNLLACSYGRPCGPNSFVVQSTCTALGACVPGADLQGVYQAQLLSGQQMADVSSLLAYLQQIQPAFVWQ